MSSRITIVRTHGSHRDYRKTSPTFSKSFSAADKFIIERSPDGAFRISHPDAPKVLGLGPTEVFDWEEDAFLPSLASTADKRREKVA